MFMYWLDPIASYLASRVCCTCIGPLPMFSSSHELASYSYMSERSCFKLMNHNPKFKIKLVTARKWKGAEAYQQLKKRSYVLTNYVLPSLISYESQPKLKIFQKYLISRSLWKAFFIKCSKIFMAKALAFILRSVSLKLLEKFRIDCYAVRRIPEYLTESGDFSNFAGLLLLVYVKILYNIILNFGWAFFQTAMISCFYKERIINKQQLAL